MAPTNNQPTMQVVVDSAAVQAMLASAPAKVKDTIRMQIEGAAIAVQREMRIEANVGATGDLRRSIRYTYTPSLLQAEISPNVPYSADLEYGGPPRWVSVAPGTPLRAWADIKGLNPYAIRASIAKKGTKAHPFVQPTFEKMKPIVEEKIAAGIAAMVEGLRS